MPIYKPFLPDVMKRGSIGILILGIQYRTRKLSLSFLKVLMLVKYILALVKTDSFVLFTGWKLPLSDFFF